MKIFRHNFWAGVLLIFGAYFYFLIFAQFAFLELVQRSKPGELNLRTVMGTMAFGGLSGSVLVPAVHGLIQRPVLLRLGFLGCAVTVIVNWFPASTFVIIAFFIGISLGVVTVTLASSLGGFFSEKNWGLGCALGTGMAYAAANIPAVFQAQPHVQAGLAAAAAFIAAVFVPGFVVRELPQPGPSPKWFILYGSVFLGILVWFDSAAFYIVQHSELKQGTWGDRVALWRNVAVHLIAALITGTLVARTGFIRPLMFSFGVLALSALAANHSETRSLTGWLYPAGVSIYSTCLVGFPAFGVAAVNTRTITWIAAVVYAFSGWICSGLGIGMAENLQRVPWQFIAAAGVFLLAPLLVRFLATFRRELAYTALVGGTALAGWSILSRPMGTGNDSVAQGRAVYISEGCINCHSQFVKPGSRDQVLWGPVRPIGEFARDNPPLFGNRRQGPDLMNIGNRRSADWLKLHFISPRKLAPASSMPSYDYLFADERGNALITYLLTLRSDQPRWSEIQDWSLPKSTTASGNADGLFQQHCAVCHGEGSSQRTSFRKAPPNLGAGPYIFAPPSLPFPVRHDQLARIIKFGIPGTDMPGHEYLPDSDLVALTELVEQYSQRK